MALRQGVLPAPFQQEFEIKTGTQNFTCTFKGAQRQLDWLEISIRNMIIRINITQFTTAMT